MARSRSSGWGTCRKLHLETAGLAPTMIKGQAWGYGKNDDAPSTVEIDVLVYFDDGHQRKIRGAIRPRG